MAASAGGFQEKATIEKMAEKASARQRTNPILRKLADLDPPEDPDQAAARQGNPKTLRQLADPDPPEDPDPLRRSAASSSQARAQEVKNAVLSMTQTLCLPRRRRNARETTKNRKSRSNPLQPIQFLREATKTNRKS
jgi:hypothetical protein